MPADDQPGDDSAPVGSAGARWGPVLAFMLVYIVSYIDRQVLTIVVDPVKLSLGLGDTEIGLLQGFLFSTVLIIAAVPMSYLIDHYNRTRVLICCMVAWSLATLYSGFADSFFELAAGRIGLAVAEAVVPMAAMSVIGDLFPRHKVGQAAAVFMNGGYFGNGAAMLLSGWLIATLGTYEGQQVPIFGTFEVWRGLFACMALLSLLIALGLLVYLREPPRREITRIRDETSSASFWSFFWGHRRFILSYCFFAGCISMVGYSLYAWTATLLIRIHQMTPVDVGLVMGPAFILTSIPGTALAAWLGSRCEPGRALQHLMIVMIGFVAVLGPLVVAMALAPQQLAVAMMAATLLVYAATHGAILTPIQLVAPNRMRGRLAAVTAMIYVIPAGLGPVIIGFLTDHVFKDPLALGRSMALTLGTACAVGILAGLFAWRQAKAIENEPVDGPVQASALTAAAGQ